MTRKVEPLIHLEQLEPRILLSGDSLLNIAPNPDQNTILDKPSTVVQEMELLHINEQVEEQISQELAPSDTPNNDVCKPIFTLFVDDNNTNDESIDADLTVDNIGPAQVNDEIAVLSNEFDGDIESKVDTTEDDRQPVYVSDNDISIEETTPIEIRGPPATETVALSGMYLVDPTVDYFEGQSVYIDFDGEQDVTYNGPIVIEGINVPAFWALDHLAGKERAIIIEVLEELNEIFAGYSVVFTTEKPEHGASYSTIYVGGDDSAFAEYGSFLGLAEWVDVTNQSSSDKGFVFSDNIGSDFGIIGSYSAELSHVIAHEIGHLLGYAHNNNHADSGILSAVANGVTFGDQQVISIQESQAWSVYACDLDGDGDNDVLSAPSYYDEIAWFENDGGGSFGSRQVISAPGGAWSVYACDLDGDGDNDVLSASYTDDKIAWYENLGGGTFDSQQTISTQADGARSVYACDMDGDGDNDVLSASYYDDKIAWYKNLGGGTFGTQQVISTQAVRAASVYACDLDGDSDNDVLSASPGSIGDHKIAWYENLGGDTFGDQHVISTQVELASSVYACDLDDDGDNDVLSASEYDDKIAWYENRLNELTADFGSQQVISTQADSARSVYACDLDGDGDNDVLSASKNDDKIAWYENLRSPGAGSPEIDVERDGTDDVHAHSFGTLEVGQSVSQAFTVRNEGDAVLVVTQAAGLVSPFIISPVNNSGSTDDWVIPAGGTQTFTVSFSPVDWGDCTDTLVLTSNDSDEGSYQIGFAGGTAPDPDIEVLGNSQLILDGDTTPNPSDHTDFGSVYVTSGSKTRTFTIRNVGTEDLNLTGSPNRVVITDSGDFTVTQQPASPVTAYGGTTIFEVTFDPSSCDTKTATINIASNDYNEDPYDFVIQGTGAFFGTEQVISTQAWTPLSVYASDLDGDGDSDVLSASLNDDKIAWYENLGGGTFGSQQVISTQADMAQSIYACDLDGDGDDDVLSASGDDSKIAWYENRLTELTADFGTQQVISTQAAGAHSVYACDLDGDGDNDVLSASHGDDKIAWYENRLNELTADFGSQQVISTQADGALSIYACDLDGDGDNDVLSASYYDDKIAWYENDGEGTFGSQQVITTQADEAWSLYACDLDGDGDNDVLSASWYDDEIAWYENDGEGTFGPQQVISTQANGPKSVYACDLDGDGDNDVLSASANDDKIAWYENLGGGMFSGQQVISTQADHANSVYACDLDL